MEERLCWKCVCKKKIGDLFEPTYSQIRAALVILFLLAFIFNWYGDEERVCVQGIVLLSVKKTTKQNTMKSSAVT